MNQRGGGPLNNGATQREAGEGSCSVRAAAITARGGNGEHLAAERHSHPSLIVSDWGVVLLQAGGGGHAGPLRECRRGEEKLTVGSKGAQKVYAPVLHCCGTLQPDDWETLIFAAFGFLDAHCASDSL